MEAPSEAAQKMPVGEPPKLNRAETFEEKLYRKVLQILVFVLYQLKNTSPMHRVIFLKLAVL